MKKLLKILGIIIILLLAILIVVPMIFKDDIVKLVKQEANNAVNAKIEFGDFNLSLIKSFPDFYFSIEDISVTGIEEFEGVELAGIKELDLVVDLMSVINGESINVKRIIIDEPSVHAMVLADGKANYLIAKEEEEGNAVSEEEPAEKTNQPTETEETEAAAFKMELKKFEIRNAKIVFEDATLPVHMSIDDLDIGLTGDFTENITNLSVDGGVQALSLTFDGVQYMKDVKILLDIAMQMNLEEFKFTFNDNEIKINELPLGFDGWLAMPNDPIDMDLKFHAKETDFKELLSMIPAEFAKDLEGVKTAGTLALDGYAKGTFIDSTYPGFGINMKVENAMFQYPDLPKSVDNIQIKASVESKDGDLNNTIVDVPVFHVEMAQNPFDVIFYLATPMTDPFIRAGMKGKLVLDNIKDMIPLEKGDELKGMFNADVSVEGNLSTIEKEQYEDFKANGQLIAEGIHFASDSLDYPVDIKRADLVFTPQFVELKEMEMQLGKSDLSAAGKLENFIGFALKDDQVLKGNLVVNSTLLDINELAGIEPTESSESTEEGKPEEVDASNKEDESTAEETQQTEEPMEVVLLPKNIDFTTQANLKKLTFDNVTIENIVGEIVLKEEKVEMTNTAMNLLDGQMTMNGFYETTDSLKPTYDFGMNIKEFDLKKTVETFNTVEKLAPIATKSTGAYSTKMTISGALDNKMEPIFETMFGSGKIKTKNIAVDGYKPLQKIAKAIKYDKLDPLAINDADISFKIVEGKVYVEPFTNKIGNSSVTIAGSNSFDQTIDYTFSFAIPREEFGGTTNSAIEGLLSQASAKGVDLKVADVINIDVQLVGPATDPTIKTDFKKMTSNATQALKDKAKEEFDKKKEELKKKAEEELEKKKKELEAQAKKELEIQKQKAKEELEKQKKAAKKKLEEEAKKKLKGLFK